MKIELIVEEALQNDVDRQVARIPQNCAQELNVKTGDVVKIIGKKITYAKIWRTHPTDIGKNSIRLDYITRRNLKINLNDKVKIMKGEIKIAKQVTLILKETSNISENFQTMLKNYFTDRIFTIRDYLVAKVALGTTILFTVSECVPSSGGLIFTEETKVIFSQSTEILHNKKVDSGDPENISYEDIGGLQEEIKKIREMVELPLKFPEVFQRLGVGAPNGVLLYGPPGTGKTLLARAVASETNSYFLSINGPEIMNKFYGESENKLREIFENAEQRSPAIIFIDEIDSIAPKRNSETGETERRIVSQLLTLMDGVNKRKELVVIGASNRPDAIDEALRRGGRFDREIEIGIPDIHGRLEILQILTRGMPIAKEVSLQELAQKTYGFVGADFSTMAKEAALLSLRRVLPHLDLATADPLSPEILNKILVAKADFDKAILEISPSGLREVFTERPSISFKDIGGMQEIKDKLNEIIIQPIKHLELYREEKTPITKSVLLYGPPGTGKTVLSQATAKESGANFILVKGSELLNKYAGEAEKSIQTIFQKAKAAAPTIIFFDEIDSLIGMQQLNSIKETNTINSQLLSELDSLDTNIGVIVIIATNQSHLLKKNLYLLGRIERVIQVPFPDKITRKALLQINLLNMEVEENVNLDDVVRKTQSYSCSELVTIVSEAKRNRLKRMLGSSSSNHHILKEDIEQGFLKLNQIKASFRFPTSALDSEESKYYD